MSLTQSTVYVELVLKAHTRYELDLLMDGAFGYNLPSPMGPMLGTLFVNKLIER